MKLLYSFVISLLVIIFFTACPVNGDTDGGGGSGSGSGPGGGSGGPDTTKNKTVVTQLSATKFQHPGKIEITWTSIKGADKYRIYRYGSKDEAASYLGFFDHPSANPEVIDNLTAFDVISDVDNYNRPFFYKISSFIDGAESNKSGFVYGVCSTSLDIYEPESDTMPSDDPFSTVFKDGSNPPYVFTLNSYPDGIGGTVSDVDWYKINTKRQMLLFTIKQAGFQNLAPGDIQVEFYYNNVKKYTQDIVLPDTSCRFGDLPEHYNNEADDGQKVNVKFRLVYKNADTAHEKLFKYKVIM